MTVPSAQLFGSPRWLRAASHLERIATLDIGGEPGAMVGLAQGPADEDRSVPPLTPFAQGREELAAARLDLYGLSDLDLGRVEAYPAESLSCSPVDSVPWAVKLKAAFSRTPVQPDTDSSAHDGPHAGFVHLVEPLLAQAREELRKGLEAIAEREPVGPLQSGTAGILAANLPRLVLPLLTRTLVLELNVARSSGLLAGDTREERFDNFCQSLRDPDVATTLLHEYPVLARQVVEVLDRWIAVSVEFLGRLASDWQMICEAFSPDDDPGILVRIDDHMGDRHRQGRCVLVAAFSSGLRVVYKPRPLAIDVHFQQFVDWLNDHGQKPRLKPMRVLDRGRYGWSEFIPYHGCVSPAEVQRFYRRQGSYLALLYALCATDFHHENLIAAGEHPYLVDLETLFHPPLPDPPEGSGNSLLRESVLGVGLLPRRVTFGASAEGVDLSGIGSGARAMSGMVMPQWEAAGTDEMRLAPRPVTQMSARHRPTIEGREVDVLEHADSISDGFAETYGILLSNREELLAPAGPLAAFASDEVRIVLRPTRTYGQLLFAAVHPDALGDAVQQGRVFEALLPEIEWRPDLRRILGAEFRDLQARDIPFFAATAGGRDLTTSTGERIADFLEESPLSLARSRIRGLDSRDLNWQLWLTRASIATVAMSDERRQWPVGQLPESSARLDREGVLERALSIGDRIAELAQHTPDGGAEWMGIRLTAKGHWSVMPAGIDLYSGRTGIALFLAYLGAVCGAARFERLSRTTMAAMREQVRNSPLHHFPIGAFDGLAGIAYTMAHAAVLWDDRDLLGEAQWLGEQIGPLVRYDMKFDIVGGAAGCVGALLAVHDVMPSAALLAAAVECGDHLVKHGCRTEAGTTWPSSVPSWAPLAGFSHGAAGIGWALLELAERTGDQRFREAGQDAFRYEHARYVPDARNWPDLRKFDSYESASSPRVTNYLTTWCHGAAGIALSRLRSRRLEASREILDELDADLEAALDTVETDGFGGNHSLCHGDIGNLDVLHHAADTYDDQKWDARAQDLGASVVRGADRTGWLCGLPLGIETPGLMTGLAGIGMGLLRLAAQERVPSVLTLEPPIT